MKKIVKIALLSLVGLLVLLVAALAACPLWVGPTAAAVARKVVPVLTDCGFTVQSISLNPYTGKFLLVDAHLANPKGYDTPDAFSVGSVSVDLDVPSLMSDTIHIRDISIDKPFVSYVFDDASSNNFDRILSTVTAKLGGSKEKKAEEKKEEGKSKKKIRIDRLSIDGTKVKYRMITLPIPLPTLTDIGKDSDGATPEEVRDSIWEQMKGSFSSIGAGIGSAASALGDGAASALKGAADLLGSGSDTASKAAAEGAKAVTDGAKAVGSAAADGAKAVGSAAADGAKAVTDGAKAVGEGAKDAVKKLGGLFGN